MSGVDVTFTDSEMRRAAVEMVAEFGDMAEHEVNARRDRARAQGLAITASAWDRILCAIVKLRDDDASQGLSEAC